MAHLTDAHAEQIKNMRADKKGYQEIRDHFWANYKMKLTNNNIAYPHVGRERKITQKASQRKVLIKAESAPELIKEESLGIEDPAFAEHVHAAFDIFKKSFLKKVSEVIS